MASHVLLSSSDVRRAFPAGTVSHNPVTGEYVRVVDHTDDQVVGEMLAVPGGAVAGAHGIPPRTSASRSSRVS